MGLQAPKHRSQRLRTSACATLTALLVALMKIPFLPCVLSQPAHLEKRHQLVIGPWIPAPVLFSTLGFLLLAVLFFDDLQNLYLQQAVYSNGGLITFPKTIQRNQSDFAIFYHICVPVEEEEQANALRIIDEQMHQIGKSYAGFLHAQLHFNTVGAPNVVTEEYMARKYCDKFGMKCKFLQHFDNGIEELTLNHVKDYCEKDRPEISDDIKKNDRRAVYMHNKGAFKSSIFDEKWRKLMTYSVTSEDCLHPRQDKCNLCGLYFVAEHGFFMHGNFWTARCDYIIQLLPPLEFRDASTEVIKNALLKNLKHEFIFDMYDFSAKNYGVQSYATELWVGSHPSIEACDMSSGLKETFGVRNDPFREWILSVWDPYQLTKKTLQWSMAPSLSLKVPENLKHGIKAEQHRMKEFTYLPGNLFKWINIYGQVPSQQSWIWTWFPDGDTWWNALENHGNLAVEVVTKNFTIDKYIPYIDPVFQTKYQQISWIERLFESRK